MTRYMTHNTGRLQNVQDTVHKVLTAAPGIPGSPRSPRSPYHVSVNHHSNSYYFPYLWSSRTWCSYRSSVPRRTILAINTWSSNWSRWTLHNTHYKHHYKQFIDVYLSTWCANFSGETSLSCATLVTAGISIKSIVIGYVTFSPLSPGGPATPSFPLTP